MSTQQPNTKKQLVLIVAIIIVTAVIAAFLLFSGRTDSRKAAEPEAATEAGKEGVKEAGHAGHAEESEHAHEASEDIELSNAQIASQQIKIENVTLGSIDRTVSLSGRLLVNADQQAHISPNFAGRVEAVYVQTGQYVKKGQALATLLVPELVDLQANIRLMQSRLDLAKSDYERERSLWQQGISAKQDYLLAENQYRQAQIEVSAAKARINAYGAASQSAGRFDLKSPINGVINSKDVVVGESVQTATQLFLIDRLDQLWLEFVVPAQIADQMTQRFNQQASVSFSTSVNQQGFKAKLMTLTPSADMQTGRLVARALVDNSNMQLRPNMLVNVQVAQQAADQAAQVVVKRSAVQQVEGKDVVFVAEKNKDGAHFAPHPVTVGAESTDRQWIAIRDGLKQGEAYVSEGSFILKSELEKGEAEHGH
jgi:cobalt-zinc-cadmium efflux system membrane fusion protein